jgi:hypothetical protein
MSTNNRKKLSMRMLLVMKMTVGMITGSENTMCKILNTG